MTAGTSLVRHRETLTTAALAGVLYAACSQLVTSATSFGTTTAGSTFWPGAGVTLAFLLRSERRAWPAVLVAVALAEGLVDLANGFAPELAVGWAVANTAEAWCGAALFRRYDDTPRRTVMPLQRFLPAAVVAGPLLGATLGTLWAVVVAGDPVWPRLPRWYVGDALGVLVVAPVLVSASWRRGRHHDRRLTSSVLASVLVVALVGVGPWAFAARWGLPFLVLSGVLLLSVRLDPTRAARATLVVALTVETVTALGQGPFAEPGAFEGLVVAQMFVAACGLSVLLVSSLTADLVSRDALAEALRTQAQQDPLTGVGNRRLLEERYDRACASALAERELVGVLVVDLDAFKQVNDRYGHQAGDAVLVETAHRVREVVRDRDTVARVGGDEFVVLLDGVQSAEAAGELAERVGAAVCRPVAWDQRAIPVSASVGAATAAPGAGDLEELLHQADAAMYARKQELPRPRVSEEPVRRDPASLDG